MTANSLPRSADRQAEIAARKVIFLEGLNRWVQERRHDERMSRAEFASLDSLGKLHAQRQSLLDNLAYYYGNHPNADVAPGVLAFITVYSDNADGCCTVSVDRMARFYSRSTRRIHEAITRLEASEFDAKTGKLVNTGVGAIVVEREPGATSKIYPWVHAAFGESRDALTWIMDARAPSQFRGSVGRPRNTPDAGVTPISVTPDVADSEPLTEPTNTPDGCDATPLTPASANTTNLDTTHKNTEGGVAQSRALLPPKISRFSSGAVATRTPDDNGAKYLWDALLAENFPFPPRYEAAASWQKSARSEPKIAELSYEVARIIARQAKLVLSETSRNGKAEWPGVGEIVRQISNHAARVQLAHELHGKSAADWDAESARLAKLDRDEKAVQAIYELYPRRPLQWPQSREDAAAYDAATSARANAILAGGLSARTDADPKCGQAMRPRPSLQVPEFRWFKFEPSTGVGGR